MSNKTAIKTLSLLGLSIVGYGTYKIIKKTKKIKLEDKFPKIFEERAFFLKNELNLLYNSIKEINSITSTDINDSDLELLDNIEKSLDKNDINNLPELETDIEYLDYLIEDISQAESFINYIKNKMKNVINDLRNSSSVELSIRSSIKSIKEDVHSSYIDLVHLDAEIKEATNEFNKELLDEDLFEKESLFNLD